MKKISEVKLFEGKWLTFVESKYQNNRGEHFAWEHIKRRNTGPGVVVVAQLVPSNRFVLIKQYRPSLEGYIIGFPAGLSDGDPRHALKELKEETGYTGRIRDISPMLKSNSGIANDSAYIVCAEIDEHHPKNKNPQQHLEPAEVIEVFLIHPEKVERFLKTQINKGALVAANLWYFFVLSKIFLKTREKKVA